MTGSAGPLLQEIRRAASDAAAEKLAAARAEADAIRASARDRAARRRAAALLLHERSAAAAKARTRAETAARLARDTLAARAAALERVFEESERLIAQLPAHPGLGAALIAALRDGFTYLPAGPATVRCATVVERQVRAALAAIARADVTLRIDETVPVGAIVEAGDGSVSVDGTIARRLSRERARLSTVVARRLLEPAA